MASVRAVQAAMRCATARGLAFGKPVNPVYHFDKADVIVSLDADFLTTGAGTYALHSRFFFAQGDLKGRATKLNRLYVVECTPTSTGTMADHRWPMRASEVEAFARQLATGVWNRVGRSAGEFDLVGSTGVDDGAGARSRQSIAARAW